MARRAQEGDITHGRASYGVWGGQWPRIFEIRDRVKQAAPASAHPAARKDIAVAQQNIVFIIAAAVMPAVAFCDRRVADDLFRGAVGQWMSNGVWGPLKSLGFFQWGTDWLYQHVGKSMICMEIFCAVLILVRMAGQAQIYTR